MDSDIVERVPMGGFARPDDIAAAIAFLGDPASSGFINKVTLPRRRATRRAPLATSLAALVNDASRTYGGRAIRWLGDGGLFYFEDASAVFAAALEMSERAPYTGLPPTQIGVQAGPVVFRDGDVYGRTDNIASRIADQAEASEVLTSQETVERVACRWGVVRADAHRRAPGLAEPVLYRVLPRA